MRWFFLVYIFVLLGFANSNANQSEEVEEIVLRIAGKASSSDLSVVSLDKRNDVIAFLRGASQNGKAYIGSALISRIRADILLVRLNDQQTIERLVSDYNEYTSRRAWDYLPKIFEKAAQPAVIPYLAEDFSLQEDPAEGLHIDQGPTEFSIGVPVRSVYSAVIALRIMRKSDAFSEKVQQWTIPLYDLRRKNPDQFMDVMRFWWDQNKKHFEDRNYDLVQTTSLALPTEPESKSSSTVDSKPTARIDEKPSLVKPDKQRSETEPIQKPSVVMESTPFSSWPVLIGVAMVLVALVVGLKLLRR